ncbi:hypothetical protein V495_04522 [Pseudogymnoascus sp. VKM F-4514 (FW-929)]|nr:hypothetical protein V495_04522 [Pseudogymnoascus sp. VKM F-4514 (FW-929)]KFY57595.1 hypothetical protein V497_05439 [Pseudogymnoascus sp. VKM F-4516 (FW-969)]
MSPHPEPAPPYPEDSNFFHNSNHLYPQERLYEQTLVEQHANSQRRLSFAQTTPSALQSTGFLEGNQPRPPYSPTTSPTPPGYDFLPEALEFTRHTTPITSPIIRLESPIAIPQTTHGMGKSFLRAWAPILQYNDISVSDFIAFIDNLNVVSTASPPLQVLDLAGGFVGMVPHHWAQIAGFVIQGTAKIGTGLVSKGRTEVYMQEVNEKLFKPRGLKASLASTEAMRTLLRIPADRPTLAPPTPPTMTLSTAERALIGADPYNATLDLDVPPPGEQTTMLAKLSAKQVMAQEKKNQKKGLKEMEKAAKKEEGQREKDKHKAEKRHRKEERREKKRGKAHKGKDRVESDIESDEVQGTSTSGVHSGKQTKEEKNARKLLWIMIESL